MIADEADYIGVRIGNPATAEGESSRRAKPKSKPGAGRFGVLNSFVDRSMRMIDPTAAAVWLVLFRDTKPDGLAKASHNSIAERIGRNVRTVYGAVRKLKTAELLTVVRRGRLNAGVSVYRVRPLVKDGFQSAIRCNHSRQSAAKATAMDCRYPRKGPEGSPRKNGAALKRNSNRTNDVK